MAVPPDSVESGECVVPVRPEGRHFSSSEIRLPRLGLRFVVSAWTTRVQLPSGEGYGCIDLHFVERNLHNGGIRFSLAAKPENSTEYQRLTYGNSLSSGVIITLSFEYKYTEPFFDMAVFLVANANCDDPLIPIVPSLPSFEPTEKEAMFYEAVPKDLALDDDGTVMVPSSLACKLSPVISAIVHKDGVRCLGIHEDRTVLRAFAKLLLLGGVVEPDTAEMYISIAQLANYYGCNDVLTTCCGRLARRVNSTNAEKIRQLVEYIPYLSPILWECNHFNT